MKHALAIALLAAAGAAAAALPTTIVSEQPGPVDLYKGTKKIATSPSMDGCRALAAGQPAGTYSCRTIVTLKTTAPPPPPDMQVGLPADPRSFPPPNAGIREERVSFTGQLPHASDEGGFRTVCVLSDVRRDDPIVLPGQPGKSHLHNFFGNGSMTAFSTPETMALGGSTCRGGAVNLSAYWQPAVVDGVRWVPPQSMISYYKNGSRLPADTVFNALPPGLRMVAGNPQAKTEAEAGGLWTCIDASGSGGHSATIPACAPGNTLWASVEFPQCWDGKNLDSPDHRSHMSYPVQLQQAPFTWSCPPTHPLAVPVITINVLYPVRPGDDTRKWKVASDTGANGTSLHADWFNGWKPETMATWIENCNKARKDCEAQMLGDGRVLDSFGGN